MHWVPGHKETEGNELADQQAKQALIEMSGSDYMFPQSGIKEKISRNEEQDCGKME